MGKVMVVFGLMLLGALWWGVKLGLSLAVLEVLVEYVFAPWKFGDDTVDGFWEWVREYVLFWGLWAFLGALCVNVLMLFLVGKMSK